MAEIRGQLSQASRVVWEEDMFLALGTSEQRRAERSRDPLVLMFLKDREAKHPQESILRRAAPVLALSTRETDLVGWAENAMRL